VLPDFIATAKAELCQAALSFRLEPNMPVSSRKSITPWCRFTRDWRQRAIPIRPCWLLMGFASARWAWRRAPATPPYPLKSYRIV